MHIHEAAFTCAIEQLAGLDSARPLVARLGFPDCWLELTGDQWPELLDLEEVQRLIVAGQRGLVAALVLQTSMVNRETIARIAHRLRSSSPGRFYLICCFDAAGQQVAIAALGLSPDVRALLIDRDRIRASDLEALSELVPSDGEGGIELAGRHLRVLDRARVTRRFFLDFRTQRAAIASAWKGVPRAAVDDRNQLALLFLCRLVFLYFLQKRGQLGSADYIHELWQRWRTRRHNQSFLAARLRPLFFGVLNTRPELRTGGARKFGALPYLNGGLFERHALERRHRNLDLPDRVLACALNDLLEHYRFTTFDSAHAASADVIDSGVDPEMLGRVFEELMAEQQRGETGTYFTPPPLVDRLIGSALHSWRAAHPEPGALDHVTVLDPACGSGAFLLGALAGIAAARARECGGNPEDYKREIVERALHGVDLQGEAALLCALRLWLCLLPAAGQPVQPLPNLDRRIRQGDALLDPLDLAYGTSDGSDRMARSAALDPQVNAALRRLRPLGERYTRAGPELRAGLRLRLQQEEIRLAGAWLRALRQSVMRDCRELRARSTETDLFGERTSAALAAERDLVNAQNRMTPIDAIAGQLNDAAALPFFSFPVHFGDSAPAGFDLIFSNPPWVRSRNWPETLGQTVKRRFAVCRTSARDGALPAGQVDLSLLFLERAITLLRPNGALAMVLPAKTFRSLYAGPARALMLRETRLTCIEDHSLDQHSVFRADAFTGCVVAVRDPLQSASVRVTSYRKAGPPAEYDLRTSDLSLDAADPTTPWLLVPPEVNDALRTMQRGGVCIGDHPALPIHRGVFTGANDVFIIEHFVPKLGDHAWIKTEGYRRPHGETRRSLYRGVIEESCVRPIVRGASLRPWAYDADAYLIWAHDAGGNPVQLPKRATRFLYRHRHRLLARTGARTGAAPGQVFRVAAHTCAAKVAWRDLATDLQAVVLPSSIRSHGRMRELIPLNTVYYIAAGDQRVCHLIAAYLNSLPLRTFARAIAERAKDAHFRFFAWVIGALPLPRDWLAGPAADGLASRAAKAAHDGGLTAEAQSELDTLVGRQFGLSHSQMAALERYDHWLRGE